MDMVSRKKSSCEGDGDRISHLPDEILCYILSFIPTIYSITTCVLSKRWKHLWKYVPKLNFDVYLMPSSQRARFANFVNSVLRVHTPKVTVLEKFSLKCETMDQLCDATKWISSSVLRNIQSLDLNIGSNNKTRIKLPNCIFSCKSLESLMLKGNILFNVPSHVCLPKLKTLKLVSLEYQDDPLTLISLSPSLEYLHLERYTRARSHFFIGSNRPMLSSTLRHIKLINAIAPKVVVPKGIELKLICGENTGHHKLVINAPALKYFKLNIVRGMIDYYIEELALLEEAVVTINFDSGISHDYCSSSLMDIYKALQHVKSLKVEHYFPTGCGFGHALPMFTRLTELDINIRSCKFGVLHDFIINSTKLENLTLNGLCGASWHNPNCVPACLLTSLRSVSIISFRGGVGVTLMAKYLIENARFLEKMEVCFDRNSPHNKTTSRKKLISFCRTSGKCIVFKMT